MSTEFDVYVDEGLRFSKFVSGLKEFLGDLKREVLGLLPDAELYLFGSVARGRYTAASDIDILIITGLDDDDLLERIRTSLKRKFINHPLELHLVKRTMYDRWYSRFLPEEELIKI